MSGRVCDDDGAKLLAWFCETCQRSWTEPSFRAVRRNFAPDVVAGFICPSAGCRGAIVTLEDGDRCEHCGARVQIALKRISP